MPKKKEMRRYCFSIYYCSRIDRGNWWWRWKGGSHGAIPISEGAQNWCWQRTLLLIILPQIVPPVAAPGVHSRIVMNASYFIHFLNNAITNGSWTSMGGFRDLLFDRYLTADPESVSRDEPFTFIGGKGEVNIPRWGFQGGIRIHGRHG